MDAEEARQKAIESDFVKAEIQKVVEIIKAASESGNTRVLVKIPLKEGTRKWLFENGYKVLCPMYEEYEVTW